MKTPLAKRDRNQRIIKLFKTDPNMDMTDIGELYNITTARVSFILQRYKTSRECANCHHFEDHHCTYRDPLNIVKTANKCSDWLPQ